MSKYDLPFEAIALAVAGAQRERQAFRQKVVDINADQTLSPDGKRDAIAEARQGAERRIAEANATAEKVRENLKNSTAKVPRDDGASDALTADARSTVRDMLASGKTPLEVIDAAQRLGDRTLLAALDRHLTLQPVAPRRPLRERLAGGEDSASDDPGGEDSASDDPDGSIRQAIADADFALMAEGSAEKEATAAGRELDARWSGEWGPALAQAQDLDGRQPDLHYALQARLAGGNLPLPESAKEAS